MLIFEMYGERKMLNDSEVAVTGDHNLVMIGPPFASKIMMIEWC
jgi:hypothetical protein